MTRRIRLLVLAVLVTVVAVPAVASRHLGEAVPDAETSSMLAAAPTATPSVAPAATPSVAPAAGDARSADDAINRVLAISVDGLNPGAISRLGPRGAPTFYRLMREGAYTLNARTAREQTRTLPGHTSMLTGRRIDGQRGHGVTFNSDKKGRTVHRAAGHQVASVFDVVHDRGGRTAMFTSKRKFALYQRTWNSEGPPDRVDRDQGRAKIDRFTVDTDNVGLVAKANRYLRASPGQFVFLHISLPDEAGHDEGFMGKRYLAAVTKTDRLLGSVLATIASRPALRREMMVLITADHGGSGGSHANPRKLANYRVPFFAWGPGVAAGRDLYGLNPTRRNPGSARTDYSGRQPIRNGDLANLATDVLDLPRVPGSEFNADQELTVFGR